MDFRLLGPLEVTERGRSVALGGPKQRSVLALLLLHANETVSFDRHPGRAVGRRPPPTAAKSIQVNISRLRKDLGADRLMTRTPGYVLRVDPGELDLARFRDLARGVAHGLPRRRRPRARGGARTLAGPPSPTSPTSRSRRPRSRAWRTAARGARGAHRRRPRRRAARRAGRRARRPRRSSIRCASGCARQLMLALYRSVARPRRWTPTARRAATSPRSWGWSRAPSCGGSSVTILKRDQDFSRRRHRSAPRTTPARADRCWSSRSHSIVPMRCWGSPCRSLARARPRTRHHGCGGPGGARAGDRAARPHCHGVAGRGVARTQRCVRIADARRGHRAARDARRRRSPAHGGRRRPARRRGGDHPRRCAVRRCAAPAGGRRRPGGSGGRSVRRRRARLGGARARCVGCARDRRAAAPDRRRAAGRRTRRQPPAGGRVADRPAPQRRGRGAGARRARAAKACVALGRGAGLLVVGLSDRWREEGLGRRADALVDDPPRRPCSSAAGRARRPRAARADDALRLVADRRAA